MFIVDASAEDILAMKERISKRRLERIYESQMDEAVRMAQKKSPFVSAPQKRSNDFERHVLKFISLILISSAGAIIWNITSIKFFVLFSVCTILMSVQEIMKVLKYD